ncbi:MAG: hypothetical protein JNK23_08525 [Opitutaceae bacterium]|nr:hypothetical protein [Opitutaceae bacterium]
MEESRGNPLGSYPELMIATMPYNLWLTSQVLEPVLVRWTKPAPEHGERLVDIVHDVDWASGRARLAFQEVLPAAAVAGDPAVLATMGVTANLQRTLAILAEFLLEPPAVSDVNANEFRPYSLSRYWCGLIDYPKNASYFAAPFRAPKHASRIHPTRRDPQHLTNAFWCSVADVDRECENGLARLRDAIKRDGIINAGDMRHLHAHATPLRTRVS